MEILAFGEEAALAHRGVDEPQVVRCDADEEGVEHVLALVPGSDGRQAKLSHFANELHRNGLGRGALLLDRHGVFVTKRLAQPLLARQLVRRAELQLVNPQRARAELLRHVHQLLVQSGDDGSHGDHRGGADQHPEDREERAEFVGAERVERQQQVLANVLTVRLHAVRVYAESLQFSDLSASMGSSRAALVRGKYRKTARPRRKASRPRSPRSTEPRR